MTSFEEFSHFFEVKLDQFDGPIDLLLHLVKKNELLIEKISLAQIAGQYLECIERAQDLDLEVAAEYLVIAATLLSVKSSLLLGRPVELVQDEEGNLIDPHEELLQKLREAAVYRQGAYHLGGRALLGIDVFGAVSQLQSIQGPPPELRDHDALLLGLAFKKLIDAAKKAGTVLSFSMDSVSIVDRMMTIVDTLRTAKNAGQSEVVFSDVVPSKSDKGVIISSFIAILELSKRQVICVRQSDAFQDITLQIAEGAQEYSANSATVFQSEFDTPSTASQEKSLAV